MMSKSSAKAITDLTKALKAEATASMSQGNAKKGNAKKKKKTNNNSESGLKSLTNIRYASAPVNVGAQFGPSYIRKSKQGVQAMADYDADDGSERVEFSDTIATQVQAGSSTAANGFGGTATFGLDVGPNALSARLAQYEELYQWYAIRELVIEYCPLISTATSVGYNIGITNSIFQGSALGTPTAADVNELSPSMAGPVYLPNRMIYRHRGMKLFSTNTDGAPQGVPLQLQINCILDGSPVESTVYGKLRVCGIVDFYKQVPPTSTDPALVLRNRILHRLDFVSRQRLFDRYVTSLLQMGKVHGLSFPPSELKNVDFLSVTAAPIENHKQDLKSPTSNIEPKRSILYVKDFKSDEDVDYVVTPPKESTLARRHFH
jgi:hypothetical protein